MNQYGMWQPSGYPPPPFGQVKVFVKYNRNLPCSIAGLRARALGWLKTDLALRSLAIAEGTSEARSDARKNLIHWKTDPDFALVREAEALARLPEAERDAWKALWAEVDELIVLGGLGWSKP